MTEAELCAMRDTLVRRGPDDAGVFSYRKNGVFLGLGHRRLSILDLSARGRQPMSTADGSLRIVFNGEIFNYRELRRELEATGSYAFQSDTDTEVLLHAIHAWGMDGCLRRIRGMYAFALFDLRDTSLMLVRDPLGVKPLYYCENRSAILFASEIKAILAAPGIERRLDAQSLYHYLTFAAAPAPGTLFQGIRKLEAGCYMRVDATGAVSFGRYWDPAGFRPSGPARDEQEYVNEIRRLFRQAVARRMVSDVPFGVFLSGGVDSSLNVAIMSEMMDRPVDTFSVSIMGDPSGEFAFARTVAEKFGTKHHELTISDDDFISFLPEMPYWQDEPLADPVCVPLYYLSKLARDSGTTVIQVGEGSDEIFSGYRMYDLFRRVGQRYYRPYGYLPRSMRSCIYRTTKGYVPSVLEDSLRRAASGDPVFLGNAIAFWDGEKQRLLNRKYAGETSSALIRELKEKNNVNDPLLGIINVELKNRLPELLLMRVDKMSMAHSIETRVPFLDEDLVAFALAIPSELKIRNGESKYILKKAAEGILPDEIIYRRKMGFCGSATTMLTPRLTRFAHEAILSSALTADMFNRAYIERLFDDHARQRRFNSFKIWNLLNLVLWHNCWFPAGGRAQEEDPARAAAYAKA